MSDKKIKVLIIFRDYLSRNRGTPLRVKSLIEEVGKDTEISLFTASRDELVPVGDVHLTLSTANIKNVLLIGNFINENKIDVVIFHTTAAGHYLVPLLFFGGKYKRVLEMHGFSEEEGRLYNDSRFFRYQRTKFFYSIIYRLCDLITTCSDTATEKLLKYNKNTHTIFGGVDLKLFHRDTDYNRSAVDDNIIIGYAGNGRKWQGIDFLLQAFSELKKIDDKFSLRLLLSEKVNIPEIKGVSIVSSLPHDEVWRFNAGCDVLVIPRPDNMVNKLSFPSKLMEYLASGKPVVASKTSDIHKIITHGVDGMLHDPGDIEGFINCFLTLKNGNLRAKIGENAAKLVKERYTWEIQGKKFANLIKNILNSENISGV